MKNMKMKMTKLLALLLSLLMLVSLLAACDGGDDGNGTTEGTTPDAGGTTTVDDGTTTLDGGTVTPPSVIPSGYIYKAFVRGNKLAEDSNNSFPIIDFWVETASQDVLSKAVYDRNIKIQENYQCIIQQVPSTGGDTTMYGEMEGFYLGGNKFELAILTDASAASCATANLLADLKAQKQLDLTNAAYDQNSITQLGMGNKLYYLSGDMNISTLDSAVVTIFNSTLLEQYPALTSPYKLVDEGKWTLAKQMEYATTVNSAVTTAGSRLDAVKGDTVGYYRYRYGGTLYHFYAQGGRISTNDSDGYPELTIGSDHSEEVLQQIYDKLNSTVNTWLPWGGGGERFDFFDTGKLLFADMLLWDVRTVVHEKTAVNYGILPMAKYDEGQETHFSIVYFGNKTVSLWAIPSFCENREAAGAMFQIMAVESAKPDSTMDAYYSKTVELTTATGSDSRRMCKLVRDTQCYDIALLYDWGGFMSFINELGTATANTYSSKVNDMSVDAAASAMNKTLEQFKNPGLPQG